MAHCDRAGYARRPSTGCPARLFGPRHAGSSRNEAGIRPARIGDRMRHDIAKDEAMIRTMRFLAVFVAVAAVSGCATIAGGLIGTGVGAATGHPVSGALIGTGVGMLIDTAPRH